MVERPRILSISFSPLRTDARVLRQLRLLSEFGDVTSVGFGAAPDGVVEHLEVPASPSLPQTLSGVAKLALRRYRAAELDAPAVRAARTALGDRRFDLVVANEARALPLAHAVAGDAPVWGDMHEWAPEERSHVLSWRLLVAPFMRWICAVYLPRSAAVTTIGTAIAGLYRTTFGIDVDIVRNAIPLHDLTPSPVALDRIRLVHSGALVPGRNIEALISATLLLDDRFTLDLYLIESRDGGAYGRRLRAQAGGSPRVTFHDGVPPADLPRTLNAYDVGVFALPPHTANHRNMMPNKLFDFVQARLALVFSPSTEIDELMARLDLGIVTDDASVSAVARALATLTPESVRHYKERVDVAARSELNSSVDETVARDLVRRLLTPTSRHRPDTIAE